jgi:N-acetylglucosamine kinase-like BadF-type ATPase
MSLSSFYIVDAGSTKTDLYYYRNGKITSHKLCGYNPNRNDTDFIKQFLALNIPKTASIHFYGSGLGNNVAITALKKKLDNYSNLYIYSDLLGAARSLLGKSRGIVSILGTGAVYANYDGNQITQRNGGYGYLIDDLGGGLELSKTILSKWLNNDFSQKTNSRISEELNSKQIDFINTFYQTKDLHSITSICKILPSLALQDEGINQAILNYFEHSFGRHLFNLCDQSDTKHVSFTGSIAYHFSPWINKILAQNHLETTKFIKKPIQGLIEYHLSD